MTAVNMKIAKFWVVTPWLTDAFEERIASIISVEEWVNPEYKKKQTEFFFSYTSGLKMEALCSSET
jgi:hypothetical protein